jgi:EAL domain-containing protein (putative c-di-GMP-specific phosphodiesterase class I)
MHPVRGFVSPGDFIPLAEESGLIVEMGEWILREACREAASWPVPLQIAVNLSPAQFMHGDLVSLVHSILLETGLAPGRLELEITEGVLIEDFDRGLALLRRLKALGVRVSMDDFGSGYSSLSYLQAFPFDKIKIDRAFVMNLGRNPQSAAIVRAVIDRLGHGLEMSIVAEGVETQEQLGFLADEGCDAVQGYFIGKPAPIGQYAALVGRSGAPPAKRSTRGAGRPSKAKHLELCRRFHSRMAARCERRRWRCCKFPNIRGPCRALRRRSRCSGRRLQGHPCNSDLHRMEGSADRRDLAIAKRSLDRRGHRHGLRRFNAI